jgi:ankyrin repeat protein
LFDTSRIHRIVMLALNRCPLFVKWMLFAVAFTAPLPVRSEPTSVGRTTPRLAAEDFRELVSRTRPVPEGSAAMTWHHRMYVESYLRYGLRDARWDAAAERALAVDAQEMAGIADIPQEFVLNAYQDALAAGCTDALVRYRHARARDLVESPDYMERRLLFTEAAKAMAGSDYPAFVKCWSFVRAARYQPPPNGGASNVQRENMALLLQAVLDLVPVLLQDETMKPVEIGALTDYFAKAYRSRYGLKETGYERIFEQFLVHAPDKQQMLLTLRVNFYRDFAWEARGHAYAYRVSDDDWQLYGERLDEALHTLMELWGMSPDEPDVATQIQQIYAQWCSPEAEVWYRKAIELDPGSYRARAIKLHFLQPKWCGSEEQLIQFGKECFATGRWDERVPFLLVDAHFKQANHLSAADQRAYLQRADVWEDIRATYETYLSLKPDAPWDRSRFAALAVKCERWATADQLLQELGDDVMPRAFGSPQAYSNALFTIANQLRGEAFPANRAGADLIGAIVAGDLQSLANLFEKGARISDVDEHGRSLLWRAIKAHQPAVVAWLLDRGGDVHEKPKGEYPILFTAISADEIEITKMLLDRGANLHAWDTKKEYNALTTALKRRHPDMVEMLLARGARIEARDKRKNCALLKAASLGYPDMVALLVRHGADLESRNSWQYTALMTAASERKYSVVEELIRLGAAVDAKTTLDTTALANASIRGHTDMMDLLVKSGADINVVNKQEGRTPLMFAAEGGHLEAVRLLLSHGADRDRRDRYGKTAADLAAQLGHVEIARLISSGQP